MTLLRTLAKSGGWGEKGFNGEDAEHAEVSGSSDAEAFEGSGGGAGSEDVSETLRGSLRLRVNRASIGNGSRDSYRLSIATFVY
jgi:hypothetical protein